jgi:addiction module antitoxin
VLKLKIKFIYRKKADKFFNKHQDIEEKFKKNIISDLKGNTNIDIKILKGYTNLLRMRINSYRIIYHVYKNEIIIIDVIDAGSRGQIYKNK